MEKIEKIENLPATRLLDVLKLLTNLGVYNEEFAVSDSYIYMSEPYPKKGLKIRMNENCFIYSIAARTFVGTTKQVYVGFPTEKGTAIINTIDCRIFRVNKSFLLEIISEIKKGNRKNYTISTRNPKCQEEEYDKYRIKTLLSLQYVIKEDAIVKMLESQARKLQECELLAIAS